MGGDLLVRGAVALARRARVPPVVVAASVVALGTSLPELVVAVEAALTGYPGIVLGNVVGSNIANVLLVGGTTAAVYPLACDRGPVRRDSVLMLIATVLFIGLAGWFGLPRGVGVALLGSLVVVWGITARDAAKAYGETEAPSPIEWVLGIPSSARMALVLVLVGGIMLPVGANLVVGAAVSLASRFGVTEAVIGLTVVAFSTSLPELATTLVAAFQKRTDVAVGTIIGSNLFNLLGIMGVAAAIGTDGSRPSSAFISFDLPVMLFAALVLVGFVWRKASIGRTAGVAMFVAYIGYIVALVVTR